MNPNQFMRRRFLPTFVVFAIVEHWVALFFFIRPGSFWWTLEPWILLVLFFGILGRFVVLARRRAPVDEEV